MIDNRTVGRTIAQLRQDRGMTQQQLAAALNVSHQAVSKWENGAALPDIQTLMDLTGFFGVTVEQLLNGDVPSDRLENRGRTLDEHVQNLGNFVNSIVGGLFHGDKKAAEAEKSETIRTESAEQQVDPSEEPERTEAFDVQKLLQMAPYMSKPAVDALLLEHRQCLSAADIARFAPYISRECLEKLIQNPETEITWETLQRIAPFLKREMVDKLARAASKGERIVKKAVDQTGRATEDIGKTLGDVSQKIGSGMEKAFRKAARIGEEVANGVSTAFNDFIDGARSEPQSSRTAALRTAAFERAIQDERWDWIAAHLDGLTDEAVRGRIAQRANALGMHDWVLTHLPDYAEGATIDAALADGNWAWLGEHAARFEDEWQEKVALAAAEAGNWQWLSDHAARMRLEGCADRLGILAYEAGQLPLAAELALLFMKPAQVQALADAAAVKGDWDFIDAIAEMLDVSWFNRLCLARAQAGDWPAALRFAERADGEGAAKLMELAIAEGNFDAIDALDGYLR